jgi:hypothetical protein
MLKNQLLQQALDKIESSIDDKASYDKLLNAGLKAAYDKTIFEQLTKGLPESKDPIGDTAKGVVFLMKGIAEKARGTAPDSCADAGRVCVDAARAGLRGRGGAYQGGQGRN